MKRLLSLSLYMVFFSLLFGCYTVKLRGKGTGVWQDLLSPRGGLHFPLDTIPSVMLQVNISTHLLTCTIVWCELVRNSSDDWTELENLAEVLDAAWWGEKYHSNWHILFCQMWAVLFKEWTGFKCMCSKTFKKILYNGVFNNSKII